MTIKEILDKIEPFTVIISTIFSPFMDTLPHRFWFALVMVGIFAVIWNIIFNSGRVLPEEFEKYHLRKHIHWYIFCFLAGCVLIAGYYPGEEAIYTLFSALRNNAAEEWCSISLMAMGLLVITSLYRSLQYLLLGAGFAAALRVWIERLFCLSCGMLLCTALEYIGTMIMRMQSRLLLTVYFIAQMFAIAGAAMWMISWFGMSFFAEEFFANMMRQQEQVERARRRTNSAPSGSEEAFHSTMNMPGTIRDAYGNVYHVQSYGVNERTYYCPENGGTVTIRDSDIGMSGSSARVGDEYFRW